MILVNKGKKGQVSIFIIVAVVIIGVIVSYLILRDRGDASGIPEELQPVFLSYESCIEQQTREAISLAETQGGFVEQGNYFTGSDYAPFSSHLNFLGFPVRYWYYVSANGLIKEQIPSLDNINNEIEQYVADGIATCNFEQFYRDGFSIEQEEPEVRVNIENSEVNVIVNADVSVSRGNVNAVRSLHEIKIDTKLGKFYNLAREIYSKQREEAFLEEYALDVMYLYAPVDGAEIQCGPKVWRTAQVREDIKKGLEANLITLKLKGNYYDLSDKKREYFVVEQDTSEAVRFLYSGNWPTKINVIGEGVDDEIMISESLGTQRGLNVMGFCYVPYHFVYDISFPVLIQIYDDSEVFQFPLVVIIDKNRPRQAVFTELPDGAQQEEDVCAFRTERVSVNVYDVKLNPVNANLSYECFNQRCRMGETRSGVFDGFVPSCLNGIIHARAGGYKDSTLIFSSNKEKFADLILDKEYDVNVSLFVGQKEFTDGNAIVSFSREDGRSATAVFPDVREVRLAEGTYDVSVYAYKNSSIILPANTKTECVDAPRSGVLGLLGGTKEKCFDITIPETKIDYALVGGGSSKLYLFDNDIQKGKLNVRVSAFPTPTSLDSLQQNFELFSSKGVDLDYER